MGPVTLGPARLWWTRRHGGVSTGPYASLNLGDGVGDSHGAVAENRRLLAEALALPGPWVWLRQVHGSEVITVDAAPATTGEPPAADGAVTRLPGVPLAVVAADCALVALACDDAAGVVHAGHAGLCAGVIEEAVAALRRVGTGTVRAHLGPCIHAERYEFGADDLERVVRRLGRDCASRTTSGRPALDIPAAVRAVLDRCGVEDLTVAGVCTAGSPDLYSHRRDGPTGRHALVVVLSGSDGGARP